MNVIDGFRSAPGCCAACGTSSSEGVIDLQRPDPTHVYRFAALYLCRTCGLEVGRLAAELAGLVMIEPSRLTDTVPAEDFLVQLERANTLQAHLDLIREAVS